MNARPLVALSSLMLAGIWAASCSSGLGNDPRKKNNTPAATAANANLPTGFDIGLIPTDPVAEPAIAGIVVPAIGATPAREVVLLAFSTAAAADDGDGSGTPLARDTTTDANGAADVFVAAISAQDVERRAFSQSLAGKFRHPRCMTCHSMAAADTIAFASSPLPHAGPPPGVDFPFRQPEVCAPCHVTSNSFPVVGWQAPAASFDIRPKTVAQIAVMAQNVPVDDTEHFVNDKRVLWALDSGVLPAVGGRNGIADDNQDGVLEPEDTDGVVRTVPGGSASFLHEIEDWRASGMVVTTAAAVKDVTLVSRASGSNAAGNGASTAPQVKWVPNPAFNPNNAAASNPIGTLFIAFQSTGSDLVAGDTNGAMDVFRAAVELRAEEDATGNAAVGGLNLVTTNTTVSCSAGGDDASSRPVIGGADASLVAFESLASNLVGGFTDGNGATGMDVYLHTVGGATQLVSAVVASSTAGGNGTSEHPALADDGSAIAFESEASDLINGDGNGVRDVFFAATASAPFVKTRASVNGNGIEGSGGACRNPSVHAAAGRTRVAFESDKQDLAAGLVAATNVFLFDSDTGATQLLNRRVSPGTTAIGDGSARAPTIFPDGSAIAFESDARNLDVLRADQNRFTDVFLVETDQLDAGRVLPFRISMTATEIADANGASSHPVVGSFTNSANFATGFAAYRTAATNLGTSDSTNVMVSFLNETSGILVDFFSTVVGGKAPLTVPFQDLSSGNPTEWAWDFDNDGNVDSTDQNPVHVYTVPGDYAVKLVTRNRNTEAEKVATGYIHVTGAVTADFTATPTTTGGSPLTVLFRDTSTEVNGSMTAWAWDFDNDGTVDSTAQNPSHTYATQGTFTVSLTATGEFDSGAVTKASLVTVQAPTALVAAFTNEVVFSPLAGRGGTTDVGSVYDDEDIQFIDTSAGSPTAWLWDFGDGTTSTLQNPTHTFATPGRYDVFLQVTGAAGTDFEVKPQLITSVEGASTATLGASKDNTIFNDPAVAGSTDHSHSVHTAMVAGKAAQSVAPFTNHGLRRALVEFDLSSIPAASIVQSATLELTCSTVFTNQTGTQSVGIHRLNTEWGEASGTATGTSGGGVQAIDGEATWLAAIRGTTNWGLAGGDFVAGASATASVGNVTGPELTISWASATVNTDVAGWIADANTNHGWIVVGPEPGGGARTAKAFDTREHPTEANRPRLIVVFRPPLP